MSEPASPSPRPSADPSGSGWRRFALWATTPNGQLLLAALLFGLSEMFVLPMLVLGLVVLPYRDGAPVLRAAPELFWTCLLAALAIPAICSLVFLAKMRQVNARLAGRSRPAGPPRSGR
jgi:hypothetical protein